MAWSDGVVGSACEVVSQMRQATRNRQLGNPPGEVDGNLEGDQLGPASRKVTVE